MRRSILLVLIACAAAAGVPGAASAQVIPDRPTLLAILGSSAVTEGFEAFNVANGSSTVTSLTTLDSTSVTSGQGPGLVVPGFALSTTTANLQWDGAGYYSIPSKAVTANGQPAVITFSPAVSAFGVDLEEYAGYPETATVTVYAADGTTVLYTSGGISIPGATPVFFGYQSGGGIGRVSIAAATNFWAPLVDNLTFGTGAPIPAAGRTGLAVLALVLAALGIWAVRRHAAA